VKYEYIKKYKLSHKVIARCLGYKNVNTFRCSTAHIRIMQGIDDILGLVNDDGR
jgi:hypothetical protein